ncbi:MAG: CDC48 family AAA ATPase [Phycisphaerae bacterium]|nr:CDC48 family AAA ATPase [Phycisphaerae bacterium]
MVTTRKPDGLELKEKQAARKTPGPATDGPPAIVLKVAEAWPKDVGRGIARIDPEDMSRLGADVGDIIELKAKRTTVAKVMPTFQSERGKGVIQVDGLVRGNCQAGLDEKVKISKVTARLAGRIVLSPGEELPSMTASRDTKYLGRLLEGLPVMAGDTVRATLFGARSHDFSVESTTPAGPVLVHTATLIRVKEEKAGVPRSQRISYEDVGGLSREVRRIREMVELPLKYPQVFQRLGIDAPKGVLLYGPPGTGKTLIARAVANETDAYFVHISGPEIMAKYYGESEGKLRAIFEEASSHAPAIIFLDELDAIAPKREEMGAEKQVERRVVAQLLALMDGLSNRGQVLVIGATNIVNTLDPALRRPGRFDREIEIGIPDANGRLNIIQIHSRGMPLADDVDLERLAQITHGFVGADLEALCREAAMACLRIIFPNIDFALEEVPYEQLLNLEIHMDHFLEALKEIDPSAIREVFVEVPDVSWEDVGGLDDVKRELIETVQWPLQHAALFKIAATRPAKGILLSGPPGTGKTLLAKAVARESEVNFISVKGPELLTQWVGASEKGIREVFRKAKQASPCILFFDEIDSLVPARGGSGDSGVTQRVVSQFLTELDGIEELKGVVVLGATNRRDIVDLAILRPGRFDLLLELPLPDKATRLAILQIHTRGKPLAKGVNLSAIVDATEGSSGADLAGTCSKAALLAIREYLETHEDDTDGYGGFAITMKHMEEARQIVERQST